MILELFSKVIRTAAAQWQDSFLTDTTVAWICWDSWRYKRKKTCMGNCLIKSSQTCSQTFYFLSLAPVKLNKNHTLTSYQLTGSCLITSNVTEHFGVRSFLQQHSNRWQHNNPDKKSAGFSTSPLHQPFNFHKRSNIGRLQKIKIK